MFLCLVAYIAFTVRKHKKFSPNGRKDGSSMKRILSKGKVIVSYISVFAILATSLVAVFTGTPFLATAATLEDMGSGSGAE